MSKIVKVIGREIIDSRAYPTMKRVNFGVKFNL